jgi:YD repeat-containing protein
MGQSKSLRMLCSALVRITSCLLAFIIFLSIEAALHKAEAANGSVAYTYDALGRVISASYDTGVIVLYTYDANGNRTQQTINVNTATLCWDTTSGCPATSGTINWDQGLWN